MSAKIVARPDEEIRDEGYEGGGQTIPPDFTPTHALRHPCASRVSATGTGLDGRTPSERGGWTGTGLSPSVEGRVKVNIYASALDNWASESFLWLA